MDRRFNLSPSFPPPPGFVFTPASQPEGDASQIIPQGGFPQGNFSQGDSVQFTGNQFPVQDESQYRSHPIMQHSIRRRSHHRIPHFHPYPVRRDSNQHPVHDQSQHHVRDPSHYAIQDPNQFAVQDPNRYLVHNGFPPYQFPYDIQQHHDHVMAQRHAMSNPKTESKPRLSKEEVEKLEKIFQENAKPSSSAKAQLADGLGLERARINNWFQNRRAKAKQERKQEEYEAQRAAEKAGSEPVSADEGSSGASSEPAGEGVRRHAQPSSAVFPDLASASESTDASCDEECADNDSNSSDDEDDSASSQENAVSFEGEASDDLHSPLPIEISPLESADFSYAQCHQSYSDLAGDLTTPFMPLQTTMKSVGDVEQSLNLSSSMPSPDEQAMADDRFSTSMVTPFVQSQPTFMPSGSDANLEGFLSTLSNCSEDDSTPVGEEQSATLMHQGMPTPNDPGKGDSFKSPPPPANIACRRNIARPANLQTTSLRSRSYHLPHGPKAALDGSKRDASSPGLPMRRIASTAGSVHGRIQKSNSGSRSPMVFNRNPEALLQWHARSPVGSITAAFPGVTPLTPLTPAVVDQSSVVSPACSDGSPFTLGGSLPATTMAESKTDLNLKTPPTSPGQLNPFGNYNYAASTFNAAADFHADQPVWTPFQTEFSGFGIHNMPSYAETSDGSLPTTPIYPNATGPAFARAFSTSTMPNMMGNLMGNTQFDWDANESVNSSKSSPNQPRSKQIQFTQNMTPQDYNSHQEK
ncbi:hypothetical protein GGR52DRAFT_152033 [Hypoxylon sp. FL1284]|nr:hypothetical protein GGR52DRAFT_152033 [Hypoxylon sp. FL1284]